MITTLSLVAFLIALVLYARHVVRTLSEKIR